MSRSRICARGIALAIFLLFLASATGVSRLGDGAAKAASAAAVPRVGGATPMGREVPSLWTASGRTYVNEHGLLLTQVYPSAVNYKDAQGKWQPIDNTLVAASRAGFAHENKANRYSLDLPATLADPVRVTEGDSWVSFALEGAHGRGVVHAASDTFAGALTATNVTYAAANQGVKEALTLSSARAPRSFTYRLNVSGGLTPKQQPSGAIAFLNSEGEVVSRFLPPFMVDRAGASSSAIAIKLVQSGSEYTLTVTPDRGWLSSPARQWPVVVDPTYSVGGADNECYIANGSAANTNFCGSTTLNVGYDGAQTSRGLLNFGLSANIPANATVIDAQLQLYLESKTTSNLTPVSVYQVTKQWSARDVTWNRADTDSHTGNPILWANPGGDFSSTAAATVADIGGSSGVFYTWYLRSLAQGWVDGSIANDGMILKQPTENVNNVLRFSSSWSSTGNAPHLTVTWEYGIGARSLYRFSGQALDDRMGLQVNVANGNLIIGANDLNIQGRGLDLSIGHVYNSLSANLGTRGGGELGASWELDTGRDVYLEIIGDGSIGYHGPSGYAIPFARNGDGTFTSPSAIDAIITKNGDNTYTLKFKADGSKENFDTTGRLTSEVDQNGNTISFAYNGSGQLTTITDTQARVASFTYDGNGHLTQISDSANRLYKFAYNTSSQLTSYTDPANGVTRYGYDTGGMLNQITDPKGNITTLAYDAYQRVTSITRGTSVTRYAYNSPDSLGTPPYNTVETDPNNHNTTFYYDTSWRVTRVVDALGHDAQTSYTANSDPKTITNATGAVTTYEYDSNDNPLSVQAPTGAKESFAYADASHPYYATGHTDAQSNSWAYAYDPNGNLSSKSEGAGQNPVTFTYNSNGTVKGAFDAKGNQTSSCPFDSTLNKYPTYCYTYDAQGNLTGITQPSPLGAEAFTYDNLSRVVSATDGAGHHETYTYDALDRLKTISYSDSSTVTYNYDLDGNLSSMVDAIGTTSFTYNSLNRLTQESLPSARTNSYGYDAAGNLTSFTDAGGTVSYAYDAADRLTGLTEPGNKVTGFTYDNNDNRTAVSYPNGVTIGLGYDASARLTSIIGSRGQTTLTSFTYSYLNGSADTNLRQSVTGMVSGLYASETTSYGYDSLNRLVSANSGSANYQYAYDANGNMCNKNTGAVIGGFNCASTGAGVTGYSYNSANELTGINGGSGFSYDGNGNLTASPALSSLAYNTKDQTTSITPAGGSASSFSYRGATQVLRETAGGTSYTESRLGLSWEKTGSTPTYYTRESGGALTAERTPSGNYYYLYDGLASIVGLTDANGNLVDSYKYEPYGTLVSSTGTVANPWRFASYYLDSATGLYKVGMRYYDPALGRWTQRDVVDSPADEHGWNRYIYAGDDPVNVVDPSGMIGICGIYWANPSGTQAGYNYCIRYTRRHGHAPHVSNYPHSGLSRSLVLCFKGGVVGALSTRLPRRNPLPLTPWGRTARILIGCFGNVLRGSVHLRY